MHTVSFRGSFLWKALSVDIKICENEIQTQKGGITAAVSYAVNRTLYYQGWCQGRARGATAPPSEASSPPPVGGNFGFSSVKLWQNDARKHYFSVILAPLSEAPASLLENFGATPVYYTFYYVIIFSFSRFELIGVSLYAINY